MDHCLDDLNKQNETPVATRPETVVRVLRKAKQIKDTDLGERWLNINAENNIEFSFSREW